MKISRINRKNCAKKCCAMSKKFHRKLGLTILYVTNKYDEAITLGTKIVFMKDGQITEVK